MIDIHTRLHILRNQGVESTSKPLYDVARQYINDNGKILCLDEFQVTDVADAMILKELFEILFSFGCILITTSNRLPNDLYKNGINRELFIPFIDVLCKYCNIITLTKIPDFRQLVTMKNSAYYYPINDNTISSIDKAFTNLSAGAESNTLETTIQVYMGRDLYIQRGVVGFVAQFTFNELCISNLSSLDYISIAEHFPTIIITGIPVINPELRDVVRRFITLIDVSFTYCALYTHIYIYINQYVIITHRYYMIIEYMLSSLQTYRPMISFHRLILMLLLMRLLLSLELIRVL